MKLLLLFLGFLASAAPIRYALTLHVEETGAFRGAAAVSTPCRDTDFVFRLYPNHLGPFISITATFSGGAQASWESPDPTVVTVMPARPCCQTASIFLEFSGRLPPGLLGYGIFHRAENVMVMSQSYPILAPWEGSWLVHPAFPLGDNLVADVADYVLTLTTPENWLPVGSGREEQTAGVWRITGTNLRELGLVLVRDFDWMGRVGPSDVMLRAFYPPGLASAAQKALEIAEEALEVFTHFLGPYPYSDLDIVFVPLKGAAGVEYPRLILIGEDYAREPSTDFFAEIVAHELAHQWWYGEVGTDQVAEPWLDEGLATYTSALYFEAKGRLGEKVEEWKARWEQARMAYPHGSVNGGLWEFSRSFASRQSYGGYVYAGAALFLHEVRQSLGDEAFFRALREFRAMNRFEIAKASEFLEILRKEGANLTELMAPYFRPTR